MLKALHEQSKAPAIRQPELRGNASACWFDRELTERDDKRLEQPSASARLKHNGPAFEDIDYGSPRGGWTGALILATEQRSMAAPIGLNLIIGGHRRRQDLAGLWRLGHQACREGLTACATCGLPRLMEELAWHHGRRPLHQADEAATPGPILADPDDWGMPRHCRTTPRHAGVCWTDRSYGQRSTIRHQPMPVDNWQMKLIGDRP